MKRYVVFLIVFLLLVAGSGCGRKPAEDPELKKIKNAVAWYNALLADGYRSLNLNSLIQVATPKRSTQAYHHMAALGEANLKMDATLNNLEFYKVEVTGLDKALASTHEEWNYRYLDIKTDKEKFNNSISYTVSYFLEKQDNKWLVADLAIEKATEQKDSGFIFQRPKGSITPQHKQGEPLQSK